MIGEYNRVTVAHGSLQNGKDCAINRCKNKDVYMVFAGDGNTSMSRHFGQSCKKHLHIIVDRAWEYNKSKAAQ